jgi:toxin-antitoxin system PIN domain toxin
MRALLDVNVLIALLDSDHTHHVQAKVWFRANINEGWASCPITQNGCIRILTQPRYPNPLPVQAVITRLGEAVRSSHHEFWSDDLSLLDASLIDHDRIHGPRQLTDIYLLALAFQHNGRLATFDDKMPISAVRGVRSEHLSII